MHISMSSSSSSSRNKQQQQQQQQQQQETYDECLSGVDSWVPPFDVLSQFSDCLVEFSLRFSPLFLIFLLHQATLSTTHICSSSSSISNSNSSSSSYSSRDSSTSNNGVNS